MPAGNVGGPSTEGVDLGCGMGTVECKNHFPGHYSMSNLNDGGMIGRPRCYEERVQSRQFCDGFLPRPLDGFLDHDREALKQTMLMHNAIFRKQVSELHRLYRKQRDLMEELKKNRDRSFFFLQRPPPSPHLHGIPSPGGKDSENAMNGKPPRRMLDLELPAEAYIDIEDAEDTKVEAFVEPLSEPGDPRERNSASRSESCLRLTLATSQSPPCLDDLNKPLGDEALEEAAASSRKFPFQANCYQDLQGKQRSTVSSSGLVGHQFLRDDFGQARSHANSLALGVVSKNAGPPSEPMDARNFSWLKEKPPSQGMETSDRTSHFSNLKYPGFSGPTASSSPPSTLPGVDYAKATSMVGFQWRQPLTGLSPVNAFPPFSRSMPRMGSEAQLYSNVFHHGSSSSSVPWSLIGDNHYKKSTLVNDNGYSPPSGLHGLCDSGEGKKGSPSGGIPWLRTGGSRCNRSVTCSEDGFQELTFAERHCRRKSNLCAPEVETLQNSPPVLKGKGVEFQQRAALNFTAASPEEISSDKDVVIVADSSSHSKLPQKLFHATVDPSRGNINLNSSATSFVLEVDLEAPPASPPEEDPEPASLVNRQRLQSAELEEEDPERAVAAAAETILKIRLDGTARWTEPPSPAEALRWFAEVAACDGSRGETMVDESAGLEGDGDRGSSPSDSGGMDYFERTALNLTETRFWENFSSRPKKGAEAEEEEEEDGDDDEEEGFAHLLLTSKRGGQSRRRRRRRDFQRDILPGLVSLSRQEVNEDLQMIGGPMRRTGGRRQGRRGRQPLTAESTGGAAAANLGQQRAAVSGRSVPGWGRTTKRCRRQRCPPVNVFPPSYS
ncbi:unnamed protein product [Spirodela intermedia]|uniref:Uncharacterized protein n=1 Tax=Spirodela intermedia TaxID=51605 RepID=A0A7I8JB94_SPIIN|nr:unnamed protein product [Spirodela intermedia]CAA6667380.1 unnamed protein product [Spirodela intermedia]